MNWEWTISIIVGLVIILWSVQRITKALKEQTKALRGQEKTLEEIKNILISIVRPEKDGAR